MDQTGKFILPSPIFDRKPKEFKKLRTHFLTPSGMTLLSRDSQPPPMYGKRGATVPPKYLKQSVRGPEMTPCGERPFCESCELELQSAEDLRRHRAQHEPCPVDGCSFCGHPSVMDKHVVDLHSSGLFAKFKKLSTPAEIEAWREERRKKYPTLANIKLRQQVKEQRQKRGERLNARNSRFGRPEDRRRTCAVNQLQTDTPMNRKNRKARPMNLQSKRPLRNDSEREAAAERRGVPAFSGTSQMEDYRHSKEKKYSKTNALSGLVGMYGSGDDTDSDTSAEASNDEVPKEATNGDVPDDSSGNPLDCFTTDSLPEKDVPLVKSEKGDETDGKEGKLEDEPKTEPPKDHSSDEGPEEKPIERSTEYPSIATEPIGDHSSDLKAAIPEPTARRAKAEHVSRPKFKRKVGLNYRRARLRRQNTMLEKLLESDIRHERNVLLQCVRYVCENNFFGIGQKEQKTS